MNILVAHNYYQQCGGEDAVFEAERDLLRDHGHTVRQLTFHNAAIGSPLAALMASARGFYNPQAARAMARLIDTQRPDVVHLHNGFPLASPALAMAAHRRGVPVVMTLHNFRLICPKAQLFRDGRICEACVHKPLAISGIVHACYRQSRLQSAAVAAMTAWHRHSGAWRKHVDAYIVLSDFAKNRLLDSPLGLRPEVLHIKPNFCADPGERPQPSGDDFLFVGRLSPEKGIDTLLQAFQQTGLPLRVIGTGPLAGRVAQAAAHTPSIRYDGFQPPERVRAQMHVARALVFPSQWYEGFPVTLAEALACGLPAIVSRVGGLPEIVEDQAQGLLVPPGDADALAAATRRLAADAPLHARLAQQARQKYLFHYTPERTYDQLQQLYQHVCDQRACFKP